MRKIVLLLLVLLAFSCKSKKSAMLHIKKAGDIEMGTAISPRYSEPKEEARVAEEAAYIDFDDLEPAAGAAPPPPSYSDEVISYGTGGSLSMSTEEALFDFSEDVSIVEEAAAPPEKEEGRLVYDIPSEMVRFSTYRVDIQIARDKKGVTIITEGEVAVDTTIRTSEVMQVELVDQEGDHFKIVANSEQQFIEPDEHTTWTFYVTPLKKGTAYISVVVSIVKDGHLKQTVYDDDVMITTSTWIEIKHFLSTHWQWLIATLLIPLGKYLYSRYKKRKNLTK